VERELDKHKARVEAPFAVIGVSTEGDFVVGIEYLPKHTALLDAKDLFTAEVCRQLQAYVADPRFRFDLPIAAGGTGFQKRVWAAICQLQSGATSTYTDVARSIGSGPRAVGAACGANPLPLVVPCHRVVGRRGLGGFMNATGGFALEVKGWLLAHERT
jgi:methylated-DNA-[protein]-cysteine S-methyltransferase